MYLIYMNVKIINRLMCKNGKINLHHKILQELMNKNHIL